MVVLDSYPCIFLFLETGCALSSQGSGAMYLGVIVFFSHGLVVPFASFGRGAPEEAKASFSLSAFGNHSHTHFQVNVLAYPKRQIIR